MSQQPSDPRRDGAGGVLIGRPFGVPVYVTPTWFIVAALITVYFAPTVENDVPGIGQWKYAVSLTFAVLLYLSVLIHELSHTVVALRFGLPVRRISLYLLGGVSEIEKPAPTPGQEAGIAVAGPAGLAAARRDRLRRCQAACAADGGTSAGAGPDGQQPRRRHLQPAPRPAPRRRPGAVRSGVEGDRPSGRPAPWSLPGAGAWSPPSYS